MTDPAGLTLPAELGLADGESLPSEGVHRAATWGAFLRAHPQCQPEALLAYLGNVIDRSRTLNAALHQWASAVALVADERQGGAKPFAPMYTCAACDLPLVLDNVESGLLLPCNHMMHQACVSLRGSCATCDWTPPARWLASYDQDVLASIAVAEAGCAAMILSSSADELTAKLASGNVNFAGALHADLQALVSALPITQAALDALRAKAAPLLLKFQQEMARRGELAASVSFAHYQALLASHHAVEWQIRPRQGVTVAGGEPCLSAGGAGASLRGAPGRSSGEPKGLRPDQPLLEPRPNLNGTVLGKRVMTTRFDSRCKECKRSGMAGRTFVVRDDAFKCTMCVMNMTALQVLAALEGGPEKGASVPAAAPPPKVSKRLGTNGML